MFWSYVFVLWLQMESPSPQVFHELAQRLSLKAGTSAELFRLVSIESVEGQWILQVREENRSKASTLVETKSIRFDQIDAVRLVADGDEAGVLVQYRGQSALQLHDHQMQNLQAAWFGGLDKVDAERAIQIFEQWVLP